jgi:eukaryotic-like serine/threonine-protein kinase
VPLVPDSKVDSTLARPLAELVGRVVAGRYRITALLGSGGVGAVYEAEDTEAGAAGADTHVALKILLPGLSDARDLAERFKREAKATQLLDHPNIVEVRDFVAEVDALYLVMELLRGRSLREVLEGGALQPRRALVIARQILEALAHAHAHGLVHRDLKPANVMLLEVGEGEHRHERVKLLDFGLVKLVGDAPKLLADELSTQAGMIFGTPAYISPEQALGRPVDARADLYSLATLLFEMLTGRVPFRSLDPLTTTRMHISAPIPTLASVVPGRAWCTPALEALIARALAKQPEERFADAADMIAHLDAAFVSLDHLPA